MDVTCFKCEKNIHAKDASRALARHLRACHTTAGPGEQLVCGQNGCKRAFSLMNSYLRHIRRVHLNENLHVQDNNDHQPPDDPMQIDDERGHDSDSLDEEEENYVETFSMDNLKQLALKCL